MFSRGTKIAVTTTATTTKANHSDTKNGNTSLHAKFASSFQLSKSSSSSRNSPTGPAWLKDGSSLKQLPGIYRGVLGQVQLQPALVSDSNKFPNGIDKLVSQQRQHQADYLNRFTDTERVHQLLSTSRLSNEILATIWAHVNKTFPGQLTNREVCLALALIAIFQRLNDADAGQEAETKVPVDMNDQDPFTVLRSEKKPPVPRLYPNESSRQSPTKARIPASSSVPNDLGSSNLLIDITGDGKGDEDRAVTTVNKFGASAYVTVSDNSAISIIDMDGGDELGINFAKQAEVWIRLMEALKGLFKRSFDILNVENCRSSALEALATPQGISFCKNLSVCYPIAHNIKCKTDELKMVLQEEEEAKSLHEHTRRLMDERLAKQINDLMVSINEYWAVLINLFHESGLTSFIELIMDGLQREHSKSTSTTPEKVGAVRPAPSSLEQLKQELACAHKTNICSICLKEFYLVNIGDAFEANWQEDDIELVFNAKPITQDNCFYYHPKCANFWLNNVPHTDGRLPFERVDANPTILQPTNV